MDSTSNFGQCKLQEYLPGKRQLPGIQIIHVLFHFSIETLLLYRQNEGMLIFFHHITVLDKVQEGHTKEWYNLPEQCKS